MVQTLNLLEDKFTCNDTAKEKRTAFSLGHAFRCAWSGVVFAFRTQRNMKIHLALAIFVLGLGFVSNLDTISWLAIVLCIGSVFAAECFNTALEAVVDLVSPDYHELARVAKDCAAGAVFVLALVSVVIAGIIFIPVIWECIVQNSY